MTADTNSSKLGSAQSQPCGDAKGAATEVQPSAAWTFTDCGEPEYLDGIRSQYDVRTEAGAPVAYCFDGQQARLIAAAPDMYEALKALASGDWFGVQRFAGDSDGDFLLKVIAKMRALSRAALAKAEAA